MVTDDRFLHTFRRSSYAQPLREILQARLVDSRRQAEDSPVSHQTLAEVASTKAILREIFGDDVNV